MTLLIHGVDDARVRSRVSAAFAEQLRANGTDVSVRIFEHCDHGCPLQALSIPRRRVAPVVGEIGSFMQRLSAERR
jgi:dipeptidyl aminopeptidase/acylaminoacyl peptidase